MFSKALVKLILVDEKKKGCSVNFNDLLSRNFKRNNDICYNNQDININEDKEQIDNLNTVIDVPTTINKKIGKITELKFLLTLLNYKINLFRPYGNSQRYDLVCEISERFLRIQIKTGNINNNNEIIFNPFSISKGKYYSYRRD